MSIKDDLAKYPCFVFKNRKLIPITAPEHWGSDFNIHHFVRQAIRKNSPDFYNTGLIKITSFLVGKSGERGFMIDKNKK